MIQTKPVVEHLETRVVPLQALANLGSSPTDFFGHSMTHTQKIIGLFWYRNAREYGEFRRMSTLAGSLPNSFGRWLRQAKQHHAHLVNEGNLVVKVEVSPEEFRAWAEGSGHVFDAKARLAYAAEKALEPLTSAS